jgi:thiol:disulfide interchange protein
LTASVLALLASACGCEQATVVAEPSDWSSAAPPPAVSRRGRLEFIEGWEAGQRYANERQLPRLVFFTAHWCTYCRQMEATTFADAQIGSLGREFVCVLVDADREPELCRRLSVGAYPTIRILAPSGSPLAELKGWRSAAQLGDALRAALAQHAFLEQSPLTR